MGSGTQHLTIRVDALNVYDGFTLRAELFGRCWEQSLARSATRSRIYDFQQRAILLPKQYDLA